MLYDQAGNKRFMRNEKRIAEGKFVYFKYDNQGRLIEEGTTDPSVVDYFIQTNADNPDFPESGQSYTYTPTYRNTYDYIQRITGTDTLECNCPGQLVKSEEVGGYNYYKEFYTFPTDDSDLTIVNLPQPASGSPTLKGIKHIYNSIDGSTESLILYPYWPATTGYRKYDYSYYNNGQLKSIEAGDLGPLIPLEHTTFVEYDYNINGSVDRTRYGVYKNDLSSLYDTTQIINYSYDTRGMLTGIADPSQVVPKNTGSGEDSLHFGLTIDYINDATNQYFNGRVANIKSSSSSSLSGSTVDTNNYDYNYNDLGWLTKADNSLGALNDHEYYYNRMGNRIGFSKGKDFDCLFQDFEKGDGWDNWNLYLNSPLISLSDNDKYSGLSSYRLDKPDPGKTWGATRTVPIDITKETVYYFSAMVKSNAIAQIYCYVKDVNEQNCLPDDYLYLSFDNLSETNWQKIEGTFDLSNYSNCVDHVEIRLMLFSGESLGYILYDDFEFIPNSNPSGFVSQTYNYDKTNPGSSKLLNFTGMAYDYTYDEIGNMTSDLSRYINEMDYDYRNLMNYSKFRSVASASYYDNLRMSYDETGMRISKKFTYKYWYECEIPIEPPIKILSMGTESLSSSQLGGGTVQALGSGGGGGGQQCLGTYVASTYYLYDNGVLLATFDASDNIIETFVNSQEGMVASYKKNDDDKLYYFIRDQIGSPRAILHSTPTGYNKAIVVQTINYHPFGAVSVAIGSYDTPYKFTGKEHDLQGNFEFTYFGSRYYNPETGYFSSIDKAGQFTNGYLYGGNNPTLGRDPDGNLFLLAAPFLMGMAFSGATYVAITHSDSFDAEFKWNKMFGHMLVGGLAGSFMNFGNAQNWASNTITGAAQAFVSGGAHNIIDGNNFIDGAMSSAISGAVFGLVSSEQYQNWGAGDGWDTNKEVMTSILNTLGPVGGPGPAMRYYIKRMNYDIPADKISEGIIIKEGNPNIVYGMVDPNGTTELEIKIDYAAIKRSEVYMDKVDKMMNTIDHEYYHYKNDYALFQDKPGKPYLAQKDNFEHNDAYKFSLEQTKYNHISLPTFAKDRMSRGLWNVKYPKFFQWRRLYMGGHGIYQGLLTF